MSCTMAGASTTAHCAQAAGVAANEATKQAATIRILRLRIGFSFSVSEFGHKLRQPRFRIRSARRDDPLHALNLLSTAGNHGQFAVKTLQIELAHDAVVSLFDQEHARAGLQLFFDQPEFPFRESEALGVLDKIGIRVRKEDLGWC